MGHNENEFLTCIIGCGIPYDSIIETVSVSYPCDEINCPLLMNSEDQYCSRCGKSRQALNRRLKKSKYRSPFDQWDTVGANYNKFIFNGVELDYAEIGMGDNKEIFSVLGLKIAGIGIEVDESSLHGIPFRECVSYAAQAGALLEKIGYYYEDTFGIWLVSRL